MLPTKMSTTKNSEVLKVDLLKVLPNDHQPYPATAENVNNLKQSLLDIVKDTAFKNTGSFSLYGHSTCSHPSETHAHHVLMSQYQYRFIGRNK